MLEKIYERFKLGCDLIKSPFSILPQRDIVSMPKIYSLSFFFKKYIDMCFSPPWTPDFKSTILKAV